MNAAADYSGWIGRQKVQQDSVHESRVQAMAATLDQQSLHKGDWLPPLWHWIFFNDIFRASELADDDHASKGHFLPPIELPRRMWAGGRLEFFKPLIVGDTINRVSNIKLKFPRN